MVSAHLLVSEGPTRLDSVLFCLLRVAYTEVKSPRLIRKLLEDFGPLALSRPVPWFLDKGRTVWGEAGSQTGQAVVDDNCVDLNIGFEGESHEIFFRISTVVVHSIGENQQRSPRPLGFPHAAQTKINR